MLAVSLAVVCLFEARADESAVQGSQLYKDQVLPILKQNCFMCHGAQVKQSGLDLTSRTSLLQGGDNGAVVVPGDPEASQLYKLVAHQTEPGMPFKGKRLSDEALASIRAWIKAGVPYGETLPSDKLQAASSETPSTPGPNSDHWAFRKPTRPVVPAVKDQRWVRNPIDAFLQAEMEKRGLVHLPEADRRTLLRRVYLDLTGLPPTPAEIQTFLADSSNDAYERVVDRLLASPEYGERWGRHWMDVWRYSDWFGNRKTEDLRSSQRHIWRWRDWIVQSLNEDKGYDRMIVEMLAGDELAPNDPKVVAATGYLARSYFRYNRDTWLQDTVEYTATSFLGVTLKCARCHSHKFDPIPQIDYYRFRAFFEPYDVRIDRVPGRPDTMQDGIARAYDANPSAPTYLYFRGNDQNPDKAHPLAPGIPSVFGELNTQIASVPLALEAYYPDSQAFVHHDLVEAAKSDIVKAREELQKAREMLSGASGKPSVTAGPGADLESQVSLAELKLQAAEAYLPALEARIQAEKAAKEPGATDDAAARATKLERIATSLKAQERLMRAQMLLRAQASDDKAAAGKRADAKKEVQAALEELGKPAETFTPIGTQYPKESTGRRLALARWIANSDNPLTARVAVNHMWLRHFGSALVPVVWNFGKSGKPPTNPELLDLLATEFMARGWSMKAMHRLMVTSSAYRMASWAAGDAAQYKLDAEKDPGNVYYWRTNVRRMEAEVVRDSILQVAGKLDQTMGGPDLDELSAESTYRRSLYYRHATSYQVEFLRTFDAADPVECFQRHLSVVPQQALALENSKIALTAASDLARELSSSTQDSGTQFVQAAFVRILDRPPSQAELTECLTFLGEQENLYKNSAGLHQIAFKAAAGVNPVSDPSLRARGSLVLVLLNHNDFVTIR